MRYIVELREAARRNFERYPVTGSQEIGVHDAAVQQQLLRLRITDAAGELPGHSVFHVEIDIDEIRAAGYRNRLRLDSRFNIRQTLQTELRAVDQYVRQVRAFHLPEFAT